MTRKILLLILSVIIVLSSLTACNEVNVNESSNNEVSNDRILKVYGEQPYRLTYQSESTDVRTLNLGNAQFDETKLYESEYFELYATELKESEKIAGLFELGVKVVSKVDKPIAVVFKDITVNGMDIQNSSSIEVRGKSEVTDYVELHNFISSSANNEMIDEYRKALGKVTDIWASLMVSIGEEDADDKVHEWFSIRVYPFGEEHSTKYIFNVKDTHQEVYSDENIVVYYLGKYKKDNKSRIDYLFYIDRLSDESLRVKLDNVKYNNVDVSEFGIVSFRNVESALISFNNLTFDDDIKTLKLDINMSSFISELEKIEKIQIEVGDSNE